MKCDLRSVCIVDIHQRVDRYAAIYPLEREVAQRLRAHAAGCDERLGDEDIAFKLRTKSFEAIARTVTKP